MLRVMDTGGTNVCGGQGDVQGQKNAAKTENIPATTVVLSQADTKRKVSLKFSSVHRVVLQLLQL